MDRNIDAAVIFTSALTEVISTVSGFSLEVLSQEPDNGFDAITGVMNLHGNLSGILFVSSSEADMRTICASMIGVPLPEIKNEDAEDALCELTNMTAGSAKLRFGYTEDAFSLSPPFIIRGKEMTLATKGKTQVVARTIGNGDITVKLKVVLL